MNQTPKLGKISPLIPGGKDLEKTLSFYEQKLGFTTIHREGEPMRMAIIHRDAAEIFLCQSDYQDLGEQISIRIEVKNIERLAQEFQSQEIIHPNGQLETKPWGPKEFAVLAPEGVCITFYEFERQTSDR